MKVAAAFLFLVVAAHGAIDDVTGDYFAETEIDDGEKLAALNRVLAVQAHLPRQTAIYPSASEGPTAFGEESTIATLQDDSEKNNIVFRAIEFTSAGPSRSEGRGSHQFAEGHELTVTSLSATLNGKRFDQGSLTIDGVSLYDHFTSGQCIPTNAPSSKCAGMSFECEAPVRYHSRDVDAAFGWNNNEVAEWNAEAPEGENEAPGGEGENEDGAPRGACTLPDGDFVNNKQKACVDGRQCVCKNGQFKCKKKSCKPPKGRGLNQDGEVHAFDSVTLPALLNFEVCFADSDDDRAKKNKSGVISAVEDEAASGFAVLAASLTVKPTPDQARLIQPFAVDFKSSSSKANGGTAVARTRVLSPTDTQRLLGMGPRACVPLTVKEGDNCKVVGGPRAASMLLRLFPPADGRGRRLGKKKGGDKAGKGNNNNNKAPAQPSLLAGLERPSVLLEAGPVQWPPAEPLINPELVDTERFIDTKALELTQEAIDVILAEPEWASRLFTYRRTKIVKVCPVRVRQIRCSVSWLPIWLCFGSWRYVESQSGEGYAFGKPNADELWDQAGVSFSWQSWTNVDDTRGKYKVLTEAEESDLLNEVDRDDCIEVFFVKKFSTSSRYGGGACWGGGTAGTKIISSDEMVSCGVDITHIAHELGHAIGIGHPGDAPTSVMTAGTAGTLMCGSGWQRDNPRRNSFENADNVQSPLIYYSFWPWRWHPSPECNDGSDCGSCNAHIPSDSC